MFPGQRALSCADRGSDRSPALSIEGSGGFVTSTAAPIATGWSDQLPGGNRTR
jgi:hypothetical protein